MTWERFAKGRTLVGVDEDDEDFATAGLEFGEKEHKLTIQEMPSHRHSYGYFTNWDGKTSTGYYVTSSAAGSNNQQISEVGGDQPHNNIQPSTTVYYWRRVS